LRSARTRSAPASASARLMARPSPWAAPETTATRPVRSNGCLLMVLFRGQAKEVGVSLKLFARAPIGAPRTTRGRRPFPHGTTHGPSTRSPWPDAGALPRLPAPLGPAAPRRPVARQARPVGPGAADAPPGLPGSRPAPRPDRRRAGLLATADP